MRLSQKNLSKQHHYVKSNHALWKNKAVSWRSILPFLCLCTFSYATADENNSSQFNTRRIVDVTTARNCELQYTPWIRTINFLTVLASPVDFKRLLNVVSGVGYIKYTVDREQSVIYFQNSTLYNYHRDFANFFNEENDDLQAKDRIPSDTTISAQQGKRFYTGTIVYIPCPHPVVGREQVLAFQFSLPSEPSIELIIHAHNILQEKILFSSKDLVYACHQKSICGQLGPDLKRLNIPYGNESELLLPH